MGCSECNQKRRKNQLKTNNDDKNKDIINDFLKDMPKEKKKFSKSVNIEDHKEINNREDNHQFKQTDKNSKKESTLENNEDNNKSDNTNKEKDIKKKEEVEIKNELRDSINLEILKSRENIIKEKIKEENNNEEKNDEENKNDKNSDIKKSIGIKEDNQVQNSLVGFNQNIITEIDNDENDDTTIVYKISRAQELELNLNNNYDCTDISRVYKEYEDRNEKDKNVEIVNSIDTIVMDSKKNTKVDNEFLVNSKSSNGNYYKGEDFQHMEPIK